MLLTWHNLAFYQDLMAGLRGAIAEGRLEAFAILVFEAYARETVDDTPDI